MYQLGHRKSIKWFNILITNLKKERDAPKLENVFTSNRIL